MRKLIEKIKDLILLDQIWFNDGVILLGRENSFSKFVSGYAKYLSDKQHQRLMRLIHDGRVAKSELKISAPKDRQQKEYTLHDVYEIAKIKSNDKILPDLQ